MMVLQVSDHKSASKEVRLNRNREDGGSLAGSHLSTNHAGVGGSTLLVLLLVRYGCGNWFLPNGTGFGSPISAHETQLFSLVW